MKTKCFQTLVEQILSKDEIAEIEKQALREVETLRFMQKSTHAVNTATHDVNTAKKF
jgi:hypothetical protein